MRGFLRKPFSRVLLMTPYWLVNDLVVAMDSARGGGRAFAIEFTYRSADVGLHSWRSTRKAPKSSG
jgi:hypothetical protein